MQSRRARSRIGLVAALVSGLVVVGQVSPATASTGPDDSSAELAVDTTNQTVTVEDANISIQLPGQSIPNSIDTAAVPEELFDGIGGALISTSDDQTLISSFATGDGVQTLIEIPNASAPSEYRFALEIPSGGSTEFTSDGSVIIKAADGMPVGGVKAPWAVDANGNPVPTSLDIEGGTLVQSVMFDDATAFPVIADPNIGSEWWGNWIRLTKKETKSLAAASGDVQSWAGILSGICAAAGPAAPVCAAAINFSALVHGIIVRGAAAKGNCVALNFPRTSPPPPHMTVVKCTR